MKISVNILRPGSFDFESHQILDNSILEAALFKGFSEKQQHLESELYAVQSTPRLTRQNYIVFPFHRYGDIPSLYFYDIKLQKEVVKIRGASALLHDFEDDKNDRN